MKSNPISWRPTTAANDALQSLRIKFGGVSATEAINQALVMSASKQAGVIVTTQTTILDLDTGLHRLGSYARDLKFCLRAQDCAATSANTDISAIARQMAGNSLDDLQMACGVFEKIVMTACGIQRPSVQKLKVGVDAIKLLGEANIRRETDMLSENEKLITFFALLGIGIAPKITPAHTLHTEVKISPRLNLEQLLKIKPRLKDFLAVFMTAQKSGWPVLAASAGKLNDAKTLVDNFILWAPSAVDYIDLLERANRLVRLRPDLVALVGVSDVKKRLEKTRTDFASFPTAKQNQVRSSLEMYSEGCLHAVHFLALVGIGNASNLLAK